MPTEIGRAHPAIRELVKHKSRLDVPKEARQRALLILHALVQEALRRGWAVTPQLSSMIPASPYTIRRREWPSVDLFLVDAGHDPATVRLRKKTRRVNHVPTKEEIEDQKKWSWRRAPKYDGRATEKIRFEAGAGTCGSLVLEDTVATRIEDKLRRAFDRIQEMTDDAIGRVEARRLREIEEAKARERAETLSLRGRAYAHWEDTLQALQADYQRPNLSCR